MKYHYISQKSTDQMATQRLTCFNTEISIHGDHLGISNASQNNIDYVAQQHESNGLYNTDALRFL
jgi:hypothetical protein